MSEEAKRQLGEAMRVRTIKSPHGLTLEVKKMTSPGMDGDSWEVLEKESDQRFNATLSRRDLHGTPPWSKPHDRDAAPGDIDRALGHAVEGALALIRRSGRKPPPVVDIRVSYQDVYDAMSGEKPGA